MDTTPVRIDHDTFFTSLSNALREAKPPDPADAGTNGQARREHQENEALAQSWPSETIHQLEASRRDWITTW